MNKYHKIQSMFKRDPETNHKNFIENQYALPEFGYLENLTWEWAEKFDGTNIRLMWDGVQATIGGKTDSAQIPSVLLPRLDEIIKTFPTVFPVVSDETPFIFKLPEICLYGEGIGRKIQKGGSYLPDSNDFILFDVKINGIWLKRESVIDISQKVGCKVAPLVGVGTLKDAVQSIKIGVVNGIPTSSIGTAPMEGIVLRPVFELRDRMGNRIITKLKYKDFIRS